MSDRRETFPPDDKRILVEPAQVAAAWIKCTTRIPPQYAVGTADHESSFTSNEVDFEPPDAHGVVFVSSGIFQLSAEEQREAGRPGGDLLDLDESCAVFAAVAEKRLDAIVEAAGVDDPLPPDVWAFLSIAHNQGLHAAIESIALHGLDWAAYQRRNEAAARAAVAALAGDASRAEEWKAAQAKLAWWLKVFAYGNDCITGGARWPAESCAPY